MIRHPRIIIESVEPDNMRLPAYREAGCGDWFVDPNTGDVHVQVAGGDVWRDAESFLIAIHELIEARLCVADGVTQEAVDAFDKKFSGDGEPGDSTDAPYRKHHRFAALIDHLIAHEMGMVGYGRVDWP